MLPGKEGLVTDVVRKGITPPENPTPVFRNENMPASLSPAQERDRIRRRPVRAASHLP